VKVSGGWDRIILLDSSGDVQVVRIETKPKLSMDRAALKVPELPIGMRYVDVYSSSQASFFLRSDGKVISARKSKSFRYNTRWGPKVRTPPKGLSFAGFADIYEDPAVLLSDGYAVSLLAEREACIDEFGELDDVRNPYLGCPRIVPKLDKGWRIVGVVSSTDGTRFFGVTRFPEGARTKSSIGQIGVRQSGTKKTTTTVALGSRPTVVVPVECRGVLKGGKVVIRQAGRLVGKAKVTKSDQAKVPITTSKLTVGKNRLKAQYLGNKACLKSAKTPFTLTVTAR
jgi:hypothetical protein